VPHRPDKKPPRANKPPSEARHGHLPDATLHLSLQKAAVNLPGNQR
jgi:hypothetical protein